MTRKTSSEMEIIKTSGKELDNLYYNTVQERRKIKTLLKAYERKNDEDR